MKNLKLLVVGTGSIGKRHIKNAISLGIKPKNILAVDTQKKRLNEVKILGLNKVFENFDQALKEDFHAAIICSPTSLHIKQSIQLAKRKKHILIEKPLDSNLNGSKKLIRLTKDNKLSIMIAYIFRFSEPIKFIKREILKNSIGKILYFRGEFSEYLPDWHPYEDYRTFYMASKKQGGGSILDQCHIMDLAHFLIGSFSSVQAVNYKISNLKINADDFSEMIIKHKNGVVSSIHTDIFGRSHKKILEIKGEKGNISWDFYKNEVKIFNSKNRKEKLFNKFNKNFNDFYIDELSHFINCFKNKKKPKVSLEDGVHTMKLILSAEKSQRTGKEEKV